ncbi:hypothetical protein AURDEDRAFT_180447 [Auricularia subglabra TFB-10046 SS5]|nr:hypothetical protein AURDEDRAFT_180447 [Auricularia subglabra TFB-10046 SS5]
MSGDARPLPAGWTAHRDERNGSLFYVNHNAQPATMSWTHPLDSAPQAAPVQHQVAASTPPPGQISHSIEYAPRPASRAMYTPSPQLSTHSTGSAGGSSVDRAPPPGTVRELHTVATPPAPPPAGVHSRSVSMSYVGQQPQQQYVAPQQLQQQYIPPQQQPQQQQYLPPPPPRLASNPNRTSSYTPRLPVIPPQQPVQQPFQQQQPSRVSALYVAQAGVQQPTRSSKFSSFFGTAKNKPFQQQIVPLQQAPESPPSTIYQRSQVQQPIITQQFTGLQQQQHVVLQPQQFGGQQQQQQQQHVPQLQQVAVQQQQQQLVPQLQQALPQQVQILPQQPQLQQVPASQQFVPVQQVQQFPPQQLQALQQQPLPPLPQQQQVFIQQQQPTTVAAPQAPVDLQVLLQLSALLAQQQGVDQTDILAQLLVAQQQLPLQSAPIPQQQQVAPAPAGVTQGGSIPVTAPQPVHPIPAQLTLGLSPSPSPQSPQSSLAHTHAAYAPGLGLYTSLQQSPHTSPPSAVASAPQLSSASPVVSVAGVPSFDATFPVDATPADAAVPEAPQPAQVPGGHEYQPAPDISAHSSTVVPLDEPGPVAAALPTPEYTPNASESEHNTGDSPGQLPAYSLEPPISVSPAAETFSAEVILGAMTQAAVEAVTDTEPAVVSPGVVAQSPVEVPAAPTPPQGVPSPYASAVPIVRPALPPRPSGPRPNPTSPHGAASHAVPSHIPAAHAQTLPSAGVHPALPMQAPHVAHAASSPPAVSPSHSVTFSPVLQGPPNQQHTPLSVPSGGQAPVVSQAQTQLYPAQPPQQVPMYPQQQQITTQTQQQPAQQAQQAPVYTQQAQQQPQQQVPQQQYQGASSPPQPPKPYTVYADPGRQQSIGDRLSSFMSSPATQAIAAKGAGILGNLFVRTAVNAVTDSDTGSNYDYNAGPSATGVAANLVQNAIQQSMTPNRPGLAGAGAANATQAQLLQAQIQANAQAQTNALLQGMQGSQAQQAQAAAALLQAQKIQAANAQASFQAAQQQQQQNTQAQIAALLKMQQQQAAQQQAQQQNVLQQVQQQQQAQQQAALQQIQQQAANQQAQQQAILQQVQQQQEAAQQAALEQVQQQTAFYQAQQQAALDQLQVQNGAFTPQIFASTGVEQPNNFSATDTLAQTIAQMTQQGGGSDPYAQAFAPDAGVAQEASSDFLSALSQTVMNGAQTGGYDPSAFLGAGQPGADGSALQAMTDALSQMQLGSEQLMSGGYDASQQTDYSQVLSSFGASDSIIDNGVSYSVEF